MLIDYHTHPLAHGNGSYALEHLVPFLAKAREEGISELGFSDHDLYLPEIDFTVRQQLGMLYPDIRLRVGLEVDYFPEQENNIRQKLSQYHFDYVIGSVHDLGDWAFDVEEFIHRYQEWDLDDLYRVYYGTVHQAVRSGLFQVIGHLDLIKVFGYRPGKEMWQWIDPVLKSIQQRELTIEVNSAGLFKPVAEVYPEEKIIARCFALNIPVTIGSDAHEAVDVGRHCQEMKAMVQKIGYRQLAGFQGGQRIMVPI